MFLELVKRLTNWLSILWLFIVPVTTLAVLALAFLKLPMGRDVVVATNTLEWSMLIANSSVLIMAYALWYLPRMLAYTHDGLLKQHPNLRRHLPRYFATCCFSIMLLAQALSVPCAPGLTANGAIGALIVIGPVWYWLLHRFGKWVGDRCRKKEERLYYNATLAVMLVGLALASIEKRCIALAYLLAVQVAFQVLIENHTEWSNATVVGSRLYRWLGRQSLVKRIKRAFRPFFERFVAENRKLIQAMEERTKQARGGDYEFDRELAYHWHFVIVSFILLIVFVASVADVNVAVRIGSLGVVLMGLTLVSAFLISCQIVKRLFRISLIAILAIIAVLSSMFGEPHDIDLVPSGSSLEHPLERRPRFEEYLVEWLAEREPILSRIPDTHHYPVVFVLADGGASRSGYWVTRVLGRLDSLSKGCFSSHILCLSGASGGSVGTGTYVALLNAGIDPLRRDSVGRNLLKHDLLSFTLARMLSTDLLNLLFPPMEFDDRAQALDASLERAARLAGIDGALNRTFAELCADRDSSSRRIAQPPGIAARTTPLLPILCINATRMQDGKPSVISTIRLDPDLFNGRVDILSLLPSDRDMKLSTAMITSARFPYISPAGRIARQHGEHDEEHYFVDGGYFDNSGAGVVLEMIQHIERLKADTNPPPKLKHIRKLMPFVLHISNSPQDEQVLRSVLPVVNDMAAPIQTMIGAYSMQTDINDRRLTQYLRKLYGGRPIYRDIALYRFGAQHESYPMNWMISERMRARMDHRLYEHPLVKETGGLFDSLCVWERQLLAAPVQDTIVEPERPGPARRPASVPTSAAPLPMSRKPFRDWLVDSTLIRNKARSESEVYRLR